MSIWIITALVLVATTSLLLLILEVLSSDTWRVGKRLKMISQDDQPAPQPGSLSNRDDKFPLFASMLDKLDRYTALERLIEGAGLNWRPDEYLAAWTAAAILLAVIGWLLLGPLAALAGLLLGGIGGYYLLKTLQQQRLRKFENQLPDALMLIASSLRSGYGLLRSLQAIRDEMKPPISVEFARVLDETSIGFGVPDALRRMVHRIPLPDLDIAVTAVSIQMDVGGNLAEVIEIVAATVRERQRIRAEVDTLTAEGKLSGIILFILPIAMAIVISFLNPTYMSALFKTSYGHLLLLGAAVLQIIGGIVMKRMLEIDF